MKYSQISIIRTSIIRGFWGQNLVRPTYMKCSQISIIRTSIIGGTSFIRGFWDQKLVRPSTADNRGLTVICYMSSLYIMIGEQPVKILFL